MNRNGFTLIELLAMLLILGLVMAIAIPNISGMLQNQKLDGFKSDAISMVEAAKMKAGKDKRMPKPKNGECILFPLNYLDDNDNILKGPNGGEYDRFDSLVVYLRSGNKYAYYVRLVEVYRNKKYGIRLIESSNINSLKTKDIALVEDNIGIIKTDKLAQVNAKISNYSAIRNLCGSSPYINYYYPGGNYCVVNNGIYYDNDGNVVTQSQYNSKCP